MTKNRHINKLFYIKNDLLNFEQIISEIEESIHFSGSNLWVLFAAILLASLGLNINSTAVIIGAMLISPLMGPIIGIGIGASTNNLIIIKKSFLNYIFSVFISIIASSIYFLFTPLNEEYSELLARTTPNIYDVFIALFGGTAGIIAISSKNRGNVLPGVAIATALMPPLCTAGYGLATGKSSFVFGAIYLFIINSVFIALSAYLFARLLKFPLTQFKNKVQERKIGRLIISITIVTVIPSMYFGYELIEKNKFEKRVNQFIQNEITGEGILVLNKTITYKGKSIELNILEPNFDSTKIELARTKLSNFYLNGATLSIKNGILDQYKRTNDLTKTILQKELDQLRNLYQSNDSIKKSEEIRKMIQKDLLILFPHIEDIYYNVKNENEYKIIIQCNKTGIKVIDTASVNRWLMERLSSKITNIKYTQ